MDGDPVNLIYKLLSLLALILIHAFFTMSETAIITLNDLKLKELAEDGNKKAQRILRLTKNPSDFLLSISVGRTLAGFLTAVTATRFFYTPVVQLLANIFKIHLIPVWLKALSLIIIAIIISFFSLLFGEFIPKKIAIQKFEKIAFISSRLLAFFMAILKPFIKILSFITNITLRIFGLDPNANEENVTEEEILMLVDAGEEKGVIEESQKEMINNIFEFDDLLASDVMTHRTDVEAVEINDDFSEVIAKSMTEGYSRIPVYEEDLDNIKGIIYIKDLLKFVGKSIPKSLKIADIMRTPHFFPETKRCGDLFNEMTEKHLQLVFVCDEYGGISGIVTIEDLLESIVGNMQDEYDNEEEEIEQINETTYQLDGTSDIKEVEEILDITFPEGDYDTVGGYIMSELGRIPGEDETPVIEYGGYSFKVEEVDERRIESITAEKLPEVIEE